VSWVENSAESLIADLGITSIDAIDIENIAWTRKALVSYERLESAAARLVVRGNLSVITVSMTIRNRAQQRFAVAHELGHLELHRTQNNLSLCVSDDLEPRPIQKSAKHELEQEANSFASALLMPAVLFGPLCDRDTPSMKLISSVAERFGTSLTASAIRYARLSPEACAIVWSERKRIRWYQPSRDFAYHVRVGEELDKYTIAVDFFEGQKLREHPTAVEASCWLAAGRFDGDAMIQEDSLALPSYDAVLTLLWINKDIEREYDPSEKIDRRWR
jgi:Zn-dependent peptidase ImmA (M78 family)